MGFDTAFVANIPIIKSYLVIKDMIDREFQIGEGETLDDVTKRVHDLFAKQLAWFNKPSTPSAVDGLRYNQTIGFAYPSNFTQLMYILKRAATSRLFTNDELQEGYTNIMEAHASNVLYEISNPPYVYVKKKPEAKRKTSRAKDDADDGISVPKTRAVKPKVVPAFKIDYSKLKLKCLSQ
jgi:hypothetical protein